jgi:hypothetical protein
LPGVSGSKGIILVFHSDKINAYRNETNLGGWGGEGRK